MDQEQLRKAFGKLAVDVDAEPERWEDPILFRLTGLTLKEIQELKERDTAKEPEEFDGYWFKCPRCGKYAGGLKGSFCHVCGQRVKWED